MIYAASRDPEDIYAGRVNYLHGFLEAHDPAHNTDAHGALQGVRNHVRMLRQQVEEVGAREREAGEGAQLQLAEVQRALAPFLDLARSLVGQDDGELIAYRQIPATGKFADVEAVHVRALIRAAGLWAAEMETPPPPSPEELKAAVAASETQARPPNPGPEATQPEAALAPPAGERADYPADGDNPDEREPGFRKTFGGGQ